jgi:4'-phosphopantetheinyl transferase
MRREPTATDCELWYVQTSEVAKPSLVAACMSLLTKTEQEQRTRFVFEKNRHEYLVTRALAHWALARWTGGRPGEVALRRTEYGRPVLDPPSDVRFNLTNTIELVACLVASGRELGVDAEPLARGDDILEVADTVFRTRERQMLSELPLPERRRRAVELWTCKEAYMKARGMGMSIPPKQFQIDYGRGAPVLDLRELDDDEARWDLATHEVEGHLLSTCIERIDSKPYAVTLRRARLEELTRGAG